MEVDRRLTLPGTRPSGSERGGGRGGSNERDPSSLAEDEAEASASTSPSSSKAASSEHEHDTASDEDPDGTPQAFPTDASAASTGRAQPHGAKEANSATATNGGAPPDPNEALADLKRPRACEACRQLKVRCEFDTDHPNGAACKRCAKSGRTCVVTVPTRKRQRKTDSRVAELEKKIDALTASLHASQGRGQLPNYQQQQQQQRDGVLQTAVGVGHGGTRDELGTRRWLGAGPYQRASTVTASNDGSFREAPASLAGNKRRYTGEVKDVPVTAAAAVTPPAWCRFSSPVGDQARDSVTLSSSLVPSQPLRAPPPSSSATAATGSAPVRPDAGDDFADIIDRGLIDEEIAALGFERYTKVLAPHTPFVAFPTTTTMADLRKTKPMLFHAVVAFSIGPMKPSAQQTLINDFYRIIAERVVVKGEKSLELVQAILVSCLWYMPPDHFEELKFYQMSHLAALMAMDIGLNRRTMANKKHFNLLRDIMGKKPSSIDPNSPEMRRAWLGCYFMSIQVSAALRRVLLIRWQPYMDECIEILETSPDALPSDQTVIRWAKLARLTEDVSFQFSVDDPSSELTVSDPKVLYTLKAFERQLQQWKEDIPPDEYSPLMRQFESILNIYMHEVAMHADYNAAKTDENEAGTFTAAHVNALSSCLGSIHETLNVMSALEPAELISFPTVALARISYVAVALIKLFSLVSGPNSRIGQVIEPANLNVEYHLDKVIELYKAAGECEGGLVPAKFAVVLIMLRNWFLKHREQEASSKQGPNQPSEPGTPAAMATAVERDVSLPATNGPRNNLVQRRNSEQMGTTPLHLLSEVAMGSEASSRSSSGQAPARREQQFPRPDYTHRPSDPTLPVNASSAAEGVNPSATPSSVDSISTPDQQQRLPQWMPYTQSQAASAQTSVAYYPPYATQQHSQHQHQQQSQQQQPSSTVHADLYPSNNHNHNTNDVMMYSNAGGAVPQTPALGGMNMGPMMGIVPELGMQVEFDAENVFALGNMLDEGFYFPMTLDGNMGFF